MHITVIICYLHKKVKPITDEAGRKRLNPSYLCVCRCVCVCVCSCEYMCIDEMLESLDVCLCVCR